MGQLQNPCTDGALTCLSPSSHVLLLPYPAQGHINPLTQLGKRLASHGVQVTLAVTELMHAKIVQAQKPAALPLNHNFQIVGIQDGLPQDFDRETWSAEMIKVVDKALAEGTLELVHALASQGRSVTCIIGDFFLPWTSFVAEKVAVPEFIFWPQCASVFSIYLHVDAIISNSGYDPYEANVRVATLREDPMELITSIPGLPCTGIHPGDLPFECPFGKSGLAWMQGVLNDRFNCMGEAYGVITNSFKALEPEVFKALEHEFQEGKPHSKYNSCWPRSNMRMVGPLVPRAVVGEDPPQEGLYDEPFLGASLWKEEVEECKQWLDSQPVASVLFVAFGSLMPLSVAQVQEVAFGLIASGQKCLWVIRKEGILATTDLVASPATSKVQFASLEEALPAEFLEENQHLCRVVRWAPQALVLSHASVGGFFSHCGWNSTLESLCYGVPLLGWPWIADQATNCWLASHVWKVGLTLQRDQDNQTCREYVESGVRQLMEGTLANTLHARAKELCALSKAAVRHRDSSVLSLVKDILALGNNSSS